MLLSLKTQININESIVAVTKHYLIKILQLCIIFLHFHFSLALLQCNFLYTPSEQQYTFFVVFGNWHVMFHDSSEISHTASSLLRDYNFCVTGFLPSLCIKMTYLWYNHPVWSPQSACDTKEYYTETVGSGMLGFACLYCITCINTGNEWSFFMLCQGFKVHLT